MEEDDQQECFHLGLLKIWNIGMSSHWIMKICWKRFYQQLLPNDVTCFLQALYFCVPFREQLLEYYTNNKNLADAEENLLTCLADLFMQVMFLPVMLD